MSKVPFYLAIAAFIVAMGVFVLSTDAVDYAGKDARTCANCHVMDAAYENWFHAPHQRVTECVDCHLPHDNPVSYWVEKARTGAHDVYVFSTGQTPDVIRAKPETKVIIQENCIRCHQDTVESILASNMDFDRYCWDCHRSVAHGERGIVTSPFQDTLNYNK